MKIVSILLALLCAMLFSPSAKGESFAFAYDFGSKRTYAVALQPIGTLPSVFGRKGFDLDVSGILGADSRSGAPVAGLSITYSRQFSLNSRIKFGPAMIQAQGQRPSIGVLAGIEVKF